MLVEAAWEVEGCSSAADWEGKMSAMELCCALKKGDVPEASGKPPNSLVEGCWLPGLYWAGPVT